MHLMWLIDNFWVEKESVTKDTHSIMLNPNVVKMDEASTQHNRPA